MPLRSSMLFALGALLCAAPAFADEAAPALTPDQDAKLKKLQAMFSPGGKVNSMSAGIDRSEAACGARIPFEVHPSTVALEPMNGDRTEIDATCNQFASAVVYTCGTNAADSDPVVKEMIRTSVKRMACMATKDRKLTDRGAGNTNYGVKYTLEDGTLTLLYVVGGATNMLELGQRFLAENVRNAQGLSLGGQQLKRKALALLVKSNLVQGLKTKCGLDLEVSVDDALFEEYSKHPTQAPLSVCYSGLQVLYTNCTNDGVRDQEITSPAAKEAILKHLKGVSCVLADTVTGTVKPNGVIEFGGNVAARVPGRSMSVESYLFDWMKANADTLAGKTKAAPTGKKNGKK